MIRRCVPALLAVALLAGCSAGTDGDDVATPVEPSTATATAATAPPSPDTAIAPRLIEVTYEGGQVRTAESRVTVARGEQLVLRVTSDVREQIHVHGYDRYLDLEPGVTAELAFTADLPGAYEVELHEAGRPLLQLRVS